MSGPASTSVSVIIPVYRAERTLPAVLAALRGQIGADTEVIAVESSGLDAAADLERANPWLRVLGLPQRALPGAARNIGAASARGSQLAFLDADAVPAAGWLAALRVAASRASAVAVAGGVANGTPGDAIGTASYLLEFSEFTPRRHRPPVHGASCNLLVDRGAFEAAGGFVEDIWPGEDTILTVPWGLCKRLAFAPEAAVWHLNRTGLEEMLRHQYRLGGSFAVICDRVEFPHGRFSRWPMLTFSPALRLAALGARARGHRSLLRDLSRCSPALLIGLGAWTAGLAAKRTAAV